MATRKPVVAKSSAKRKDARKILEDENKKLRAENERLREINANQLQRLVNQELLKSRIKELEQRLKQEG